MIYQPSKSKCIVAVIVLLLLMGVRVAFGSETKKIEFSPFMDFNTTLHGGIGKHFNGFAGEIGAGAELLYVINDNFAFGVNGKTNLVYDCYLDDDKRGTVVDEYGIWTGSLGGIVYMGEMFYLSYMAIVELDTFHDDTYISGEEEDISVDKIKYTIEDMNYTLEAGLRTDYHMSIYTSLNSQLVIPEGKKTRYQVKVGLKYHI